MLVNCPRCGFTQPQDKYCAQCGVDMETFRPPPPSFSKKILGNPAIQISLFFVLIGAVGLFLYQRRQHDLQDRVSYLKGGAQVARSVSSPNGNEGEVSDESVPQELLTGSADTENAGGENIAASTTANGNAAVAAPAAPGTDPTKAAPTAPLGPPGTITVSLVYAEFSSRGRDQVYEDSSATGQFNQLGDYVAGIIPEVSRRLSLSNREVKILHREQRTIETQKPLQFFQGLNSGIPETEIGFGYYLELTEVDANTFRGNIEVARSWRTQPGPSGVGALEKRQFPAVFELGRGSGFFMAGLMPRSSFLESDTELVTQKPFEVLRSNDFRSGNSEYFLFLEFIRN